MNSYEYLLKNINSIKGIGTKTTKLFVPFELIPGLTPVCVQDATPGSTQSGLFLTPTTSTVGGNHFILSGKDYSSVNWKVGYKLDFRVDLPTIYYRTGNFVDYTAYLAVARMIFLVGLSGEVEFKVNANNESEKVTTGYIFNAGYSILDQIPI